MTKYAKDEALWRDEMVSLLEAGKLNEIDAVNLKEEAFAAQF